MPIQGPLKELSIHDVFQLADLSRKTGRLAVSSELRADEGVVYFHGGRVVHASIRSKPLTVEDTLVQSGRVTVEDMAKAREFQAHFGNGTTATEILVQAGAVTARELEALERQQVESVVFELMSWREGYFTFEEVSPSEIPGQGRLQVATESLLMEAARRIDEWSRIADIVPDKHTVPALAASSDAETRLDLLPAEWEVLSMIDGERDVAAIAAAITRSEFDVARTVFGLVATGVVEIRRTRRRSLTAADAAASVSAYLDRAFVAIGSGDLRTARANLDVFLELSPDHPDADRARAALDAVQQLLGVLESSSSPDPRTRA
jgi:hypothetical protein